MTNEFFLDEFRIFDVKKDTGRPAGDYRDLEKSSIR